MDKENLNEDLEKKESLDFEENLNEDLEEKESLDFEENINEEDEINLETDLENIENVTTEDNELESISDEIDSQNDNDNTPNMTDTDLNNNQDIYTKSENDNFGESKNSKGIFIAVILVIAVVAVLLLFKGCNKGNNYTVKFDTNGGNSINEQVVAKNNKATAPLDPTRDGYKFIGWYVGDEKFDFNTEITSDMTISARWEKSEDVKVIGVTLDQTEVTLKMGETLQLTAIVTPDSAKEKSVTWTSENSSIATVDETGNITAVKNGTTKIKVVTKEGNYEAECKVTVSSNVVKVTGITLDKTSATVGIGNTINLVATVKPKNASNKGVTWSSSDKSIATVVDGKVKGLKEGTVTITAETKDGNYKATATITVKNIKVTGVSLNKTSLTITVGETYTLKATVKPTDATNKSVTWSSNDSSVATVDSNGKVKAIKEGNATITVTTKDGSYTATANIKVEPAKVTKVTISGSSSVIVGNSITLKAAVTATGNANKTVTWASEDESIATVNSKGVVKGVKVGSTNITATAGGITVKKKITVTAEKISLSITIKAVCAPGNSTIQGYTYVIKNNGKEYTDYRVIKINDIITPKGGKIAANVKQGKQSIIVVTNNNGDVTITGTIPTSC